MDERTSEPRVNVVANAPPSARVRLYVDGLPYPKEQSNVLVEGTNGLGIWDMYMGRHTAQLVLETADGVPLTSGMSHFVVASPGGCTNDCSRQGLCMDAHAGQYCICNDGWVGVDCSQRDLWRSGNASNTAGGLPGQGLVSRLMRQLEENLGQGVMQTRLDLETLGRSVSENDATVLGRKDAAEKAMDQFMLQVEADTKQLALEHGERLSHAVLSCCSPLRVALTYLFAAFVCDCRGDAGGAVSVQRSVGARLGEEGLGVAADADGTERAAGGDRERPVCGHERSAARTALHAWSGRCEPTKQPHAH